MKHQHLATIIVLSIAAGCGGPPPPSPLPSPTAEATALPAAPSATATASAAPEAPLPSAFSKIADIGDGPTLYPMGKRVFIGRSHGATFLEIKDGKIERADRVSPGLDTCKDDSTWSYLQPGSLHGDFDKTAWLARLAYSARTTLITLDRWDGARWRRVKGPQYSGQLMTIGAFPWRRSTLFLVTWYNHSTHFDVLEGADKAPVPAASGKPDGWPFTRLLAAAAVKTKEGELVLAGSSGDGPAVERWMEPRTDGKFEVLPVSPGEREVEITHLVGRSSSDLFAGGAADKGPYLAHHDGKQWSRVEVPFTDPVTDLAFAADGSLWAVARAGGTWDRKPSSLWRRQQGRWSRVPASDEKGKPLVIEGLWALDDGDVWLSAGGSLYRSRPAEAVFAWSDPLCPAISMARPATENCQTSGGSVFVLLYTLVRTTPKDYDFPQLRKAIKGHPEFAKVSFAETEERGRRYFVAFMNRDSYDEIGLGKKLVSLVKKEVQGSNPSLLCGSPRVVRELQIDVMSGEVVKK